MISGLVRTPFAVVTVAAWTLLTTTAAAEQAAPMPRGHIEIDGNYRVTSTTFSDSSAPVINAEPARINTSYEVPSGLAFSASGAVQVWKRLGVGIGVSRFSSSGGSPISASIPHPFTFSQPRDVQGSAAGITRQELNVLLQVRGFFPISPRMTVTVFGGPSWLSVSQDVVTGIEYSESYPYDSASFRGDTRTQTRQTRAGIGAGGDLAYFFSRQAGVGVGVRYSGGTASFPALDGGTVESKIGGLEIGTGVRFRF